MFIKPKNDLKVRDNVLKDFLPVEGREVADSGWWQRRLAEDAVEVVEAPKPLVKSSKIALKGDDK